MLRERGNSTMFKNSEAYAGNRNGGYKKQEWEVKGTHKRQKRMVNHSIISTRHKWPVKSTDTHN